MWIRSCTLERLRVFWSKQFKLILFWPQPVDGIYAEARMSFDLYFCREEPADVTLAELREWSGKWKYFTEYEYDGEGNQ